VTITDQTNVGVPLSSYTLSMEKAEIRRTVINPCVNSIVQDMEAKGFSRLFKKIPNSIGTLGTSPTSNLTYTQGIAKLYDLMGQSDDLTAILSADQAAVLANAQAANSNVGFGASGSFKNGRFSGPMALGVSEWKVSPAVAYHTSGTFTASTPLTNIPGGQAQGATSIVTDGWASGATSLKEGDIFTIANVFEVNSATFQKTGRLRQFTVTADISDTTGAITLGFSPAMYSADTNSTFATIDVMPADNAAITVWAANPAGGTLATTSSRQGLIFAPGTVVLAMADAATVDAPVCVFAQDAEAGISMRLTKSYDIDNDENLARLDIFFGWNLIRPEWGALRVQGA
jgi:hypothetical protein